MIKRFIFFGAITTLIYTLVSALLIDVVGFTLFQSHALAYVLCSLISYYFNCIHVFEAKSNKASITKFASMSLSFLLILTVTDYSVHRYGIHPLYSSVVIPLLYPVISFTFMRFIVFKPIKKGS
ncbi:GtrA family protein, partial [Vibrio sp. 10N.261.55.A7]|uniref:GtrA family protein n=1 Tax=Vibrio sp. 10N.261.55.A7 TaxID=1880851 RepID=UPI000CB52D4A